MAANETERLSSEQKSRFGTVISKLTRDGKLLSRGSHRFASSHLVDQADFDVELAHVRFKRHRNWLHFRGKSD